ncbi:crossover junction endodeoxyribonuclease RuvC [candidate division WOR-3 bacterium]|nr:crossover junction endodeoxyribonuclease RuvC [candidate division WOR-3 bacterium]
MRILGIDPGLGATGYGVVEDGEATEFGLITTDSRQPIAERLRSLGEGVEEIVRRTRPARCALETLFFRSVGARSVIRSAEARGTIVYVLGRNCVPVTELTPATIKLAVTGSGRASKHQMNYMVKRLLGLNERVSEHAADALAAAYCLSRRQSATGGRRC